jgi:hypothetical protein
MGIYFPNKIIWILFKVDLSNTNIYIFHFHISWILREEYVHTFLPKTSHIGGIGETLIIYSLITSKLGCL